MVTVNVEISGSHETYLNFIGEKFDQDKNTERIRLALKIAYDYLNGIPLVPEFQGSADKETKEQYFEEEEYEDSSDPTDKYYKEIMEKIKPGCTVEMEHGDVVVTEENIEQVARDIAAIHVRKEIAKARA